MMTEKATHGNDSISIELRQCREAYVGQTRIYSCAIAHYRWLCLPVWCQGAPSASLCENLALERVQYLALRLEQ